MADIEELSNPRRVIPTLEDRKHLASVLRKWADEVEAGGVIAVAIGALHQNRAIETEFFRLPGVWDIEMIGLGTFLESDILCWARDNLRG